MLAMMIGVASAHPGPADANGCHDERGHTHCHGLSATGAPQPVRPPTPESKLAGGFQGIPFGSPAALDTAPLASCTRDTEPTVRWSCQHVLGSTPVTVAFVVDEGIYDAWLMMAKGATECSDVMRTVSAAYGAGQPKNDYDRTGMAERLWFAGQVAASWTYNQFTEKCTFFVMHRELHEQVEAKKRAAAAAAAAGL